MATQTNVSKLDRSDGVPLKFVSFKWAVVLLAVVMLTLLVVGALSWNPVSVEISTHDQALRAISARYQGMADLYAVEKETDPLPALMILSDRYQGQADVYAAYEKAASNAALQAMSLCYQARADAYTRGSLALWMRELQIISNRYQAQADLQAAGR